jgi:hypothetical protein
VPIDTDRLAGIRHLASGGHDAPDSPDDEMCLMEAVAYVLGIPHTDHPPCVSGWLGSLGRSLNDRLPTEARQLLIPLIPLLPGTAGDGLDERRRWLAANYSTRTLAPKWLDRAGLTDHAAALRALPEIVDEDTYDAAYPTVRAARDAAWKLRSERYGTIRARVRESLKDRPAVTVAAAAAVTAADAAAVTAADAVAAAAAVTVTAADAVGSDRYWAVRDAVYNKVRTLCEERHADLIAETHADAIDLYERLIRCEVAA